MELWASRNWDLSLKSSNPMETFKEFQDAMDRDETPLDIESLPNKDWLRQT